MEILPLALFLVMLELTVGAFVSLYLLDLRGDSSRNFIVFQGVLYMVFALLTVLAMNAFAAPEIVHGFGLDESWLKAQGPLVVAFSLLMIPWNVLLWSDKQARGKKGSAMDAAAQGSVPTRRWVRFGAGGLTSLVGIVALFDVAMAYRTLANSHLGGTFVVLSFLAGGMALGGVMTAMLLGHWYLNTPTASGKPLEFVTTFLLVALVVELGSSLLIGPSTAHVAASRTVPTATATVTAPAQPTGTTAPSATAQAGSQNDANGQIASQVTHQAPLGAGAMVWLQYLMGFIAPLILGGIALYLTRGRSFQSATGMLYLCVAFIFIGEVIGRGLLLLAIF
jgi:DMSO reductase anchor subunit